MSPGLQFSSGAWGLFPSSLVVGNPCNWRVKVPFFLLAVGRGRHSACRDCLPFLAMWPHGQFTTQMSAIFQVARMHLSAFLFCDQLAGENPLLFKSSSDQVRPTQRNLLFVITECNDGSLNIAAGSIHSEGRRLYKGVGHCRSFQNSGLPHYKLTKRQ